MKKSKALLKTASEVEIAVYNALSQLQNEPTVNTYISLVKILEHLKKARGAK